MTTNDLIKISNKSIAPLDKCSFSHGSASFEHQIYSDFSSANRNKRSDIQVQRKKYSSKEFQKNQESKPCRLASLLEQAQNISLKGRVIRFSSIEEVSRASQASIRSQMMDIEQSQTQASQFVSKDSTDEIFNKPSENLETEGQKYMQTLLGQRQRIEGIQGQPPHRQPSKIIRNQEDLNLSESKSKMNSFACQDQSYPLNIKANSSENQLGGAQRSLSTSSSFSHLQDLASQIQPQNCRKNALYNCLNQYFDESPKIEQIAPQQRINQISSQENLVLNSKSAESSNGTTATCDSFSQLQKLSKLAPVQSSLSDKLSEVIKSSPSCLQLRDKKKRKSSSKIRNSGKDHLLELLNRRIKKNYGARKGHLGIQKPVNRKDGFSLQEDEMIIKYYKIYGVDWKSITKHLPGRTEFAVRKRFLTLDEKYPNLVQESKQSHDFKIEESLNNPSQLRNTNDEPKYNEYNLFEDSYGVELNQNFSNGLFLEEDLYFEKNLSSQFLFPQVDFLNGGILGAEIERKNNDIELDFFGAPQGIMIDENQQQKPIDCISLFDMKFDEHYAKLNNDQDCWNDLLDFNQELKASNNLTPVFNSVNAKQNEMSVNKSPENLRMAADESDFLKIPRIENNTATPMIVEPNGLDRIHELLNQIKSIEMIFKVTRQEIQKLRSDF